MDIDCGVVAAILIIGGGFTVFFLIHRHDMKQQQVAIESEERAERIEAMRLKRAEIRARKGTVDDQREPGGK